MDTATTTSQELPCDCEPGAHDTGEPGGFYVTVKDGGRRGFLLGPYGTHGEALALVPEGKRLAVEADQWAAFYEFGTSRIRDGERPPGVLNGRLAATARQSV